MFMLYYEGVKLAGEFNPFTRSINSENLLGIVTQVTYIGIHAINSL